MRNDRLDRLAEFPFRRLAALLAGEPAPAGPAFDLSIGEPKHAPPHLLAETVAAHAHLWNRYPPVNGTPEFRAAAAAWLTRRFGLPSHVLDPERMILPLAGTKEGLYLLPSVVVPADRSGPKPVVLMPDPVYAVYYGAAVMAGAEPVLLPATAASGFLPDLEALSPALLARTALFYLCTPANPQGAVADRDYLRRAVRLAREYDFLLAVDECYSELWDAAPPPGALEAAWAEDGSFANVVVLHSLSKRSSAPGLRSGFIAGDPELLARLLRLRAYGSPVQPLPLMAAATVLWQDETHVEANRALYREKFDLAERRLAGRFGFYRPAGGFFLWLDVGDGEAACRRLWREAGVKVLPGGYLSAGADAAGTNPGAPFVRVALVDRIELVDRALERFAEVLGEASRPRAAAS
ncbi:aminotransferase class I/II-fold pyridoxal phosphate-dependent enzyme [Benzoatithermus flavus]|uniref:Aminotransferase class I/II-fold pyridoxal phosphate-dependent enzyme n=1 Tax=Benzoatithermus flavus TaxID=3108223 RepID=A0ABU8XQH0_9PROT